MLLKSFVAHSWHRLCSVKARPFTIQRSSLRVQSHGKHHVWDDQMSKARQGSTERHDGLWFNAGLLLVAGGLLPSLIECANAKKVLDQSALTRFGILMVTDVLFAATSYAFIIVGEIFGTERSQGRPVVPYPGPWVELSGERVTPKGFKQYLLGLPAFIGLTVPLAVSIFSAFSGDTGLLTATCLVPYLTTLFSQIWMEAHFVERGSYMWPMVPVTHMIYRLWQLGRSSAIVAILNGPQHLLYMQACLAILWVLNFGAVMAWMPWLYRWHLQPEQHQD